MMDAVHRYEGTVNQVMGDGIMALFGAPIAHEDHAIRACSLRMQDVPSGPAETFTGAVRIDPLFDANPPSRVSGGRVTFEPGARTAWHTHPFGQTLIVTAGAGIQQWGGPTQEIREGDVVWIPPGQKHWHGATATTRMTHIAIQEFLDGKNVEWLERMSDEQYRRWRRSQCRSAASRHRSALPWPRASRVGDDLYAPGRAAPAPGSAPLFVDNTYTPRATTSRRRAASDSRCPGRIPSQSSRHELRRPPRNGLAALLS
jgi:quercetin dioxygenase-like cupin family protein